MSTLEIDELLNTLLERLIKLTNADGGTIAIFDDGDLVIKTSVGILKKEDFVGLKLPKDDSFLWRVINEGNVVLQEISEPGSKLLKKARDLGIKTSLGVPLKRLNKTVGAISIHWLQSPYLGPEDIHMLEITAEKAAMAIINAQLFNQVKVQAHLIDLSPDAILVRNLNDVVKMWNKSAEKIYGWTKEEAVGRKITDLIYSPEQVEEYMKAKEITLKEGQWSGELKHKTKDGKTIIAFARFKLLYDKEGKPSEIIAVNSDITEKKKIEQLLNRSQRLEAVGRLASGIVHNLNNILQPIMMATQILKRNPNLTKSELKYLDIIESSSQRGASIANQILSFVKGISGKKVTIQLGHLINEIQMILKETFPKNINIEVEVPKDLNRILADPNQIMQVLMNLAVNAKDAMPNGGKLTIKAQNLNLDKHYATQLPGIKPGAYVLITVEDTGTGIPPEIIDKIFDPFFTTKEPEKGTGLGLSTVNTIVKEHNGFINVYSEVGKGTIFKTYLPAIAEEAKVESKILAEEIPTGNGELILVVEDEPAVQEMIKVILEENNCRVITASNGAEGLVKYIQNKDKIKLILTDLGLPIMNGFEMIKAIKKIEPSSEIMVISGLETPTELVEISAKYASSFLQKPFDALTLMKEVARMLKN